MTGGVVLLTDRAWPDDGIERAVIEAAGHRLIGGPASPPDPAQVEALAGHHRPDAIMTCWAEVTGEAIRRAGRLRIVQRIGVGLDNIAVPAATASGAWVANVPDYCVGEVADHAVGLLLAWARGLVLLDRDVKAGHWRPDRARLRRVADLTVGIVGMGRIGRATAQRLGAFGCTILASDPHAASIEGVAAVPLDELLSSSDAVVLHAPLTERTHHLIDAARLARMKPGAFLVNVSRGPLVDAAALAAAIASGRLGGAGLDVVEGEPHPPAGLTGQPAVIVTPHVAFSSDASLAELRRRSAEEVVRVLAGERPHHPCNEIGALA